MVWTNYKLSIVSIPTICTVVYFFIYHPLFFICLSLISIGLVYGVVLAINQSKSYTTVHSRKIKTQHHNIVKWLIERIEISTKQKLKEVAIKKHESNIDLDAIIDQICDLLLEDLVLPWYRDISYEQVTFTEALKQEVHLIVSKLKIRCAQIDWVKVISNDLVVQFGDHYQQVRRATLNPEDHPFRLHAYLETDESENDYLRVISEALLLLLLPSSYSSTLAIRHLLREILVFNVFKPTINLICEPDYFNENILLKLELLNLNNELRLRKFTLASNYENFIKLIETSNDLDKLEQFWNYIVTEIMQATAIKNLLKEGVISNDNHQTRLGTKGELLMNRDLTKYLNQLRRAKIVCERSITAHGGRSYLLVDASTNKVNLANRKILSLNMILSCITGRHYLHLFLETFGTHLLVKFWYDVWKLHSAPSHERHRVATNIYKTYITRFGSAVRDEIDDATVVRMKSFLVGEQAEPDAFSHAQATVYRVLQRDYYASFLVSKQYDALCRTFNSNNLQDFDLKEQLLGWSTPISADENFDESEDNRAMHQSESPCDEPSQSVPKRLADLRNQLSNKQYALTAAKEGSTFDETVLASLERDCADLNQEISTLECLLENVDLWWSYLGQWQAQVLSDVVGNGRSCLAVLIRSPNSEQDQVGWVITRTLHAWQQFYYRLKELQPSVPMIDAFRVRSRHFSQLQYDSTLAQQMSSQLERFLQTILHDEHMSSFELVYQFLNPSIVDNDRQSTNLVTTKSKHTNPNKNPFHIFRSDKTSNDLSEIDSVRFLEGRADSIAKPFYAFIDILFGEQRTVLKLIRMTLVQFIRVTYGSTINRQVRRYIVGLFQEEYLVKYLIVLRDTFWPETPPTERPPSRTDEERLERRQQAKRQLLSNIPETISLIFGSDNARLGAEHLFELFQDNRLNKHLFYKLLMMILFEIFPELQIK